ncbi:DUF7843 domain-containing protein [Marinobacter gelidimuriae]
MVHYQSNRFDNGLTSQADDENFFLTKVGKTSPKAEFEATLSAITKPGGGHARCRFPAGDY